MPNAYVWLQGGREGGQKSPKDAYVIHGCSRINMHCNTFENFKRYIFFNYFWIDLEDTGFLIILVNLEDTFFRITFE